MSGQEYNLNDSTASGKPSSQLDLYQKALEDYSGDDDLLSDINLGLGNYDSGEQWQQVESYQAGLFGDSLFSRNLFERAVFQTKRTLALDGYQYYNEERDGVVKFDAWDEDPHLEDGKLRKSIERRGDELWRKLNKDKYRLQAMVECSGFDPARWLPPQWRMAIIRHEASRSKNSRLLDNTFGRVQEKEIRDNSDLSKKERKKRSRL